MTEDERRTRSRRDTDDVRLIAKEAADEAVRSLLEALGVDATDPRASQADFQWLREAREGTALVKRSIIWTGAAAAFMGICTLIWYGVQGALGKP